MKGWHFCFQTTFLEKSQTKPILSAVHDSVCDELENYWGLVRMGRILVLKLHPTRSESLVVDD